MKKKRGSKEERVENRGQNTELAILVQLTNFLKITPETGNTRGGRQFNMKFFLVSPMAKRKQAQVNDGIWSVQQ